MIGGKPQCSMRRSQFDNVKHASAAEPRRSRLDGGTEM